MSLVACGAGGGSTTLPPNGGGSVTGNARISAIHFGRLVDVYGLRTAGAESFVELARADVLIGPDILDERGTDSPLRDRDIDYDFLSANPDTLQPRLLIAREIGSPEFEELVDALDDDLRKLTPGVFGQDVSTTPHPVIPRNAAIRVTFSEPLDVDDGFFVSRDTRGRVDGLRNTEAVQLLNIVGNPNDGDPSGDFTVIPARVIPRGDSLILDPVLLGSEGLQYQTRNNATGLPESPDQTGANIRLAFALEGPLAIPGLFELEDSPFIGTNNGGVKSAVRDFRSGNHADDSSEISRGFIRDPEPPRIVGELLTFVERVDRRDDGTSVVTLFKDGREHELDRGDVLRVIDPSPGLNGDPLFAAGEIVSEPVDDLAQPEVQHVRVVVRNMTKVDEVAAGSEISTRERSLEDIDPSNHAGFPADLATRETWLRENAPRAVLVSEFTATRRKPNGTIYGDDPANFLSFTPEPLELEGERSLPGTDVSPFAGAILRFSKPVDLTTARSLDSFFFATRNLLDEDAIRRQFVEPRGLDPEKFNLAKFWTPHLVVSRVFDQNGSQTELRLQPVKGFFLNSEMRPPDADKQAGRPFVPFPYYLHLVGGPNGIKDLSGNPIDFQTETEVKDFLTIPFTLDTRARPNGEPVFADNLVVHIARRFASPDEDEQPSIYRDEETARAGEPLAAEAFPLQDVFGAVVYLNDGRLLARPTSRVTQIVDDQNQQPPPPQGTDLAFCPASVMGDPSVASASAGARFGSPVQNPLNPFGARLQTVWREIDMSLSRIDPFDFNLDVEQMYWAPFGAAETSYDEFDLISMFLSHGEKRPEPCVGLFSALPQLATSGLSTSGFADNIARNLAPTTRAVQGAVQVPAFIRQRLIIDPARARLDPTQTNRYLPLPEFQQPYFVWRDETSDLQGGNSGIGSDVPNSRRLETSGPYLPSPYLGGQGRFVTSNQALNTLQFNRGTWCNSNQYHLLRRQNRDFNTDGGVGAIALPLLADIRVHPDNPDLPEEGGFRATGFNGWQIALAVQSAATPNFRVYSGGFSGLGNRPPVIVDEGTAEWTTPRGGYTPAGTPTPPGDNSVFWVMADFLKRQTVMTAGFVDLTNPHRMPPRKYGEGDPRLGPYFVDADGPTDRPASMRPRFDWTFEPPLEQLPAGTAVVPEFRAASRVDPDPWRAIALGGLARGGRPDETNFPLDPLKAGDAHMKKFDDRFVDGATRNHWAYYYNRQVTDYTRSIDDLVDDDFLAQFVGANETLTSADVRYFNWRFIMRNNVDVSPAVSPAIESFAVVYRFEK